MARLEFTKSRKPTAGGRETARKRDRPTIPAGRKARFAWGFGDGDSASGAEGVLASSLEYPAIFTQ
jgi:hypothetical protein